MRQRKKKWAEPYLASSSYVIQYGQAEQDLPFLSYSKRFLEIGTGKGDFLTTMASRHPENYYIGLEIQPSVLALAVKKAEEAQLGNISFYLANAERIDLLFPKNSFDAIYLNFSDPWPKARHAKRRLTAVHYLQKYDYLLKKNGYIYVKTDNHPLYLYTLETIINANFELLEKEENYILLDNDVASEYEQRFRALQHPIYRIVMRKKD